MARYRKKPIVIEAIRITEEMFWKSVDGELALPGKVFVSSAVYHRGNKTTTKVSLGVPTLEGTMYAGIGHWWIKGVKGEEYFCDPEVFEMTYEPA